MNSCASPPATPPAASKAKVFRLCICPTKGSRIALTPRELEVLQLIAAGRTAKEAARQLDIAPKTADHHIQNLYAKIGVSTRAGAALYALERGLVRH